MMTSVEPTYLTSISEVSSKQIKNAVHWLKKKKKTQLNHITITTEDVKKTIKTLKPNKACGPDNIHPKVLIECKDTLTEPLTRIFNKLLADAKVPRS